MLVLDEEKKPHAGLVRRIIEDAAATSAGLYMQRDTEKTTLQNKGVQGIEGLENNPYLASQNNTYVMLRCIFYLSAP